MLLLYSTVETRHVLRGESIAGGVWVAIQSRLSRDSSKSMRRDRRRRLRLAAQEKRCRWLTSVFRGCPTTASVERGSIDGGCDYSPCCFFIIDAPAEGITPSSTPALLREATPYKSEPTIDPDGLEKRASPYLFAGHVWF